jgi:hypothetical protein
MASTPKRKATVQGLGERTPTHDGKITVREEDAEPERPQNIACPPPSGAPRDTVRMARPSTLPPASGVATTSPTKRRPSPVRVDRVGVAAIELASRTRSKRSRAPRLAGARPDARGAALGPESTQVLALIDGRRTVEGLADATGIPIERVEAIVARLARLGLVTSA